MPDSRATATATVGALLARELGLVATIVHVERRDDCDLYRARGEQASVFVKVGPEVQLAPEASNIRRSAELVGNLAPRLIGYAALGDGSALLAMELVPGVHLRPGRLTRPAWVRLIEGLVRMHGQGPDLPAECCPLADDFVTLSFEKAQYSSLPGLRARIAEVGRVPGLDGRAALELFDDLEAEFEMRRSMFVRPPRFVHGDITPSNVLARGARCWLVDWTWLKHSDYALDLANLKLLLDWVWPARGAQWVFESVLHFYSRAFADDTLFARMQIFAPLASVIQLAQYSDSPEHPYNGAVMRALLPTAQRDRALWSLDEASQRLAYAQAHRPPSPYAAWGTDLRARARRALTRLLAPGLRALIGDTQAVRGARS